MLVERKQLSLIDLHTLGRDKPTHPKYYNTLYTNELRSTSHESFVQ